MPRRFARQRWRAWIETAITTADPHSRAGSPVSDGGRGLKLRGLFAPVTGAHGSPVSDGGRGLKHGRQFACVPLRGFARQRWRAWIETRCISSSRFALRWFARQRWRAWIQTEWRLVPSGCCTGFARQRWRAWIETRRLSSEKLPARGFARQRWRAWIETLMSILFSSCRSGSPVSDGGRGLKHCKTGNACPVPSVRPSAMAGVD